ncbi:MAG: hypothetical protein JWN09_1986 [Microbacteriaceae bacterium]|nr:hypothetical protein [Microbacteriaceae bacterium]
MASRLRNTKRAEQGSEEGITLVELIVAMFLGGIVIVLVAGMYLGMSRVVQVGNTSNNSTKAASLAMTEVSTALRFATTNPIVGNQLPDPAFVSASNESVTVNSYIDASSASPQPVQVNFSLDSSRRLIETRYASHLVSGNWVFYTTAIWSRILTGAVVAQSGSEPYLFTYLDSSNAVIVPGSTGLTSTQYPTVAAVQVTVKLASASTGGASPVVLQNIVGLPNLGTNRTGQ